MKIKKNPKLINITYKHEKLGKIYLIIIIIIIFIPISCSQNKKFKRKLNYEYENEITITIIGTGEKNIISNDAMTTPSRVYVNGVLQSSSGKKVTIPEGDENTQSIIKMEWDSPISNCDKLFFYLSNIINIDMSKFDMSSVTSMGEYLNIVQN